MEQIADLNVLSYELLPTPRSVKEGLPITPAAANTVLTARGAIKNILDGRDPRMLLVVGPCSIHELEASTEYATRLAELAKEVEDTFVILMRVYFSKPRTTVGWKGLINDPFLDDSFRIDEGLFMARKFLLSVSNLGLPAATEALDSIIPQYMDDLIVWNAIGARTTESQTHREMASGLSTPVGFKNGTDGSIQVAINALKAVREPHHFLGIDQEGKCAVLHTRGNRYAHVVLRGGPRPNYDATSVSFVEKELQQAKLPCNIMIDCSHGNSMKDPSLQPMVFDECMGQVVNGNNSITGLMIESHLFEGRQEIPADRSKLKYGVSVTDGCIDWPTTAQLIRTARERLAPIKDERFKRIQNRIT